MSTRQNPGPRDLYAELAPDEPFFLLRARDDDMPIFVRFWAWWRQNMVAHGMKPKEDIEVANEAFQCATEAQIWNREYRNRLSLENMEFDDRGRPTTGPHAPSVEDGKSV
jgi:hypothetical protein